MNLKNIYFICTGNSCRSQMAEGFAKHILGDQWHIESAGIEAHGVDINAVRVMREAGIDISEQRSKLIDPVYLNSCQLVVTLCGDARDRCPVTPDSVAKLHWPLMDPAQATGTENEILMAFRQVRDQILENLIQLKSTIK